MVSVGEIHHVCLNVRSLENSLRFYEEGLGLRRTLEMDVGTEGTWQTLRLPHGTTGRSVFLQGPQQIGQIELIEWDLPAPEHSVPKEAGDPGIFLICFRLDRHEIPELFTRLEGMGYDCHGPPRTNVLNNYGPISVFVCRDPDGNMVEFVSLPTREEIREFRSSSAAT